MSTSIKISKKVFNPTYLPYLTDYEKRTEVYYGGAGSGKSHFIAQKLIYKGLTSKRKILVIRKVGNSLRDSVFSMFKSVLSDWKLYEECKIKESLLTIDLPNGTEIIFKGLDDSEKIKSIAGITDIFIEECTEINQQEFSQLNLRLRSKEPYNQIFCAFNPVSKSNWVYKMWFEKEYNHDTTMVLKTTYKDNKFLPDSYIESLLEMKETDPVMYKIYVEGTFASMGKLIYTNWVEEDFDWKQLIRENPNLEATFGFDFGYINDPSCMVCVLLDVPNRKMYIFDEFARSGLMNNELAELIIEKGYHKEIIVADSAEKKSIDEIRGYGVSRMIPARKGPDSILNGIQFIQQFKMVVHPSCKYTKEELLNYEWQKDRLTGEHINKPVDKYNHCLTGDTIVNTPNGDFYIKDLVDKEGQVFCFNGKEKTISTFKDVRLTQKQAQIYKIELEDGSFIRATYEHPVLTQNGWKIVGELTPKEEIVNIFSLNGKIKSVSLDGIEDVYNMEVDDHHNFSVNGGFIVHNCLDALRYACERFSKNTKIRFTDKSRLF